MDSKFDYLKNIYQDLDNNVAYAGLEKLFRYVKGRDDAPEGITKSDVKLFLHQMDSHTKHGNVPRKFVRRPIKVSRPGSFLGSDLADLTPSIAKHNKGHRYILVLMDLFSRQASLVPLKNKTGKNVAKALEKYLESSPYTYTHFFADQGPEYLNRSTNKIYDKYNIIRYNIFNRKFKNSIVERFIRSLKTFLFKHFTHKNTFKFLDILPKYQKIYNSTPHKGLGYKTPDHVHNLTDLEDIKNQEHVQLRQKIKNYGNISKNEIKRKHSIQAAFKVGSHVRILLNESERVFGKSYEKIFSDEIFMIRKIENTTPISYWLSDLKNRPIQGVVYHKEISPVKLPDKYYVEKVISSRINPQTGKKQYLVKWLGYPKDFNSFVDKVYKVKGQ